MNAALLIAEDEPMIARILREKLVREGYTTTCVTTVAGLEAGVCDCDVALVDATLDADGLAAMRALADRGVKPRGGWFALLEVRAAADGARAVDAGAAGVILKPFKPTAVAAQVAALLAAVVR